MSVCITIIIAAVLIVIPLDGIADALRDIREILRRGGR